MAVEDDDQPEDLNRQILARLERARSTLSAIDKKAAAESVLFTKGTYSETERDKAQTQAIKEANFDMRANRRLRWKYARWVFCYLVVYSIFVGVLLIAAAFKICGFALPSSVLDFLVGSTAVSAIGLVYAVTHGLFSK